MSTPFAFSYPDSPFNLPTSSVIDISRVVVGVEPSPIFYSLNGSLPLGLIFNSANGTISGLTAYGSITNVPINYTVDASYSTGVVSTSLSINVNFLPSFFYVNSPYIIQQNVNSTIIPTYLISNIQGIVYSLISSPPLSNINMTLRSADGYIIGTPPNFSNPISYTIRADNKGITYDTAVIISVQTLPTIAYPQSTYIITQGIPVTIVPVAAVNNAGVSYVIQGCALPLGLVFNTSTGIISGTPLLPTTFREYKITVFNLIGSTFVNLIINIIKTQLAPPVLSNDIDTGLCLTNPIVAMRRKAEILKYKKNSATLTKNQYLSLLVKGNGPYAKRVWANQSDLGSNPNISDLNVQGNTLICNSASVICAPTSASDVPASSVTTLCYDPAAPLVGYVAPNRTKVDIGFKWPQRAWQIGDMGFPVGKAGNII